MSKETEKRIECIKRSIHAGEIVVNKDMEEKLEVYDMLKTVRDFMCIVARKLRMGVRNHE